MRKKIIVLLMCMSLALAACGKNEPVPEKPEETQAPQQEVVKPDWQVGFEYVLSVSDSQVDQYLLYDLDANGEPEMITRVGAGDDIEFYTYDWAGNGSVTKAYIFSGYADIAGYKKDGTILFHVFGNTEKAYKLNYSNGAGTAEQIFSREMQPGDVPLVLESLPMYPVTDLSGMAWNGNPTDESDRVFAEYEEEVSKYVEGPGDKPTYDGEVINWIGAYKTAISEFGSYTAQDTAKYCIYDVDDDGVPEMVAQFGGSAGEPGVYVIDAKFGGIVTKTKVYDGNVNIAGLSEESTVLLQSVHMGTESVYKIVYTGAQYRVVEAINARTLTSGTDALKFSYIRMHDFSDTDGIYWPGNPDDNNAAILAAAK